jgi:hypothetical protein
MLAEVSSFVVTDWPAATGAALLTVTVVLADLSGLVPLVSPTQSELLLYSRTATVHVPTVYGDVSVSVLLNGSLGAF